MTFFPYTFLFCQNVLSQLLIEVEEQKKLQGIKINRESPPINHLPFVDDNFIFFRANVHSCMNLKRVLRDFCYMSGMKINFSKSNLFISPNCKMKKKRWFSGILGVKNATMPSKYLGIEFGLMNKTKGLFSTSHR